jgi:hypothetical protein
VPFSKIPKAMTLTTSSIEKRHVMPKSIQYKVKLLVDKESASGVSNAIKMLEIAIATHMTASKTTTLRI